MEKALILLVIAVLSTDSAQLTTSWSDAKGTCTNNPSFTATGAWCVADTNQNGQWLQFDLGVLSQISWFATKGRGDADEWVTKYSISGSRTGSSGSWTDYGTFDGNTDRNTIVKHGSTAPIFTRFIRFYPIHYHSWKSMRVDIYGSTTIWHQYTEMVNPPIIHSVIGSNQGRGPERLLDNDLSTFWDAKSESFTDADWVVFEFNNFVNFVYFGLYNYGDHTHDVKDFELQYSNSGDGPWTTLNQWTALSGKGWKWFDMEQTLPRLLHKLVASS